MLNRLAELVDFNAVRQENGTLNVLVGSGQPLVLGVQSFELSLVQNEFDGGRLELAAGGPGDLEPGQRRRTRRPARFRNDSLYPARRELGQLALGLTEVFNAQHRQGVDAERRARRRLLQPASRRPRRRRSTTAAARAVTVTIADVPPR